MRDVGGHNNVVVVVDDKDHVRLTIPRTPIVDGYQNLVFEGVGQAFPNTIRIQYKHSGLDSRSFPLGVSTMNNEVCKLHSRSIAHGWLPE